MRVLLIQDMRAAHVQAVRDLGREHAPGRDHQATLAATNPTNIYAVSVRVARPLTALVFCSNYPWRPVATAARLRVAVRSAGWCRAPASSTRPLHCGPA